jgi:hypothetical protein
VPLDEHQVLEHKVEGPQVMHAESPQSLLLLQGFVAGQSFSGSTRHCPPAQCATRQFLVTPSGQNSHLATGGVQSLSARQLHDGAVVAQAPLVQWTT